MSIRQTCHNGTCPSYTNLENRPDRTAYISDHFLYVWCSHTFSLIRKSLVQLNVLTAKLPIRIPFSTHVSTTWNLLIRTFFRVRSPSAAKIAVRPSVRMKQLESSETDFRNIWHCPLLLKCIDTLKFCLRSEKSKGRFTWRPICISVRTSSVNYKIFSELKMLGAHIVEQNQPCTSFPIYSCCGFAIIELIKQKVQNEPDLFLYASNSDLV